MSLDPFHRIDALDWHGARARIAVALGLAIAVHAAAACVRPAPSGIRDIVQAMLATAQSHLRLTIDVDQPPLPPPVDEPEPEPEPEPDPLPKPPPIQPDDDPYDTPPPPVDDPYDLPPAPSQATKILTVDQPVPLAETFASGDGKGPGYGMVAAAGTGTRPTFRHNAVVGGRGGGRGHQVRRPPRPDLSRPPSLVGERAWSCPFPSEADSEGINGAVVALEIQVRANGTAQSVRVVADPGYGFGREARLCALRHRYGPAHNRDGAAIAAILGPIRIRFVR